MTTLVNDVSATRFLRFWAAQTLSQLGQRFGLIALPVVAIETLNAGIEEVGYLTASLTACYLLVGLPAGAWVDRWAKRPTMMRSAVIRAVALASIPAMWAAGHLGLPWLYAVAIAVGTASVFFDVAYQSYVPFLVSDQGIEPANARLEASAQVSAVGGPAAAGLLLKVVSAPLVLGLDALAYLLCAVFLATVRDNEPRRQADEKARRHLGREILAGIRFVSGSAVLRRLVVSVGVSNFFATIVMTLTPLLILKKLDLGTTVMGVVLGVGTLGGLLGAMLLPKVRSRLSAGTVMAGGLLLAALSTSAFPAADLVRGSGSLMPVAMLTLGQFGMTLGAVMFNITQFSVRQRVCPKELLARMNASIRFVVWGSMPLAALLAGWLGGQLGVAACMWIGVVGTCVTVLPIFGMDRLIRNETQAVVVAAEPLPA
ncbi:MFS transporter [Catellatospora sp. TT07R-123]|uniref:MFS transporter n=1 Tax=Catellatospora sp. TT07R-123 TaxID=2733863 RepID=UPI001B0D71D1|nr:MFS transporter [Catellatospora sp. TT07R-123]GHJ48969.1 MFS transporter [Catellatospora sp. TT07R-123]